MTDKQRAAMYRARRYESALVAHEDLKSASVNVLMAALAHQLKSIGVNSHAEVARDIAAQLVKELCERHEIRLAHGHEID